MNREFYLISDSGDEYTLSLSSDGLNLYDEIRKEFGIELISIELMRIKGEGFTSRKILAEIENLIADTFEKSPDSILFYYCDFLNPVPSGTKKLLPQEYRSRLFSCMFQRYLLHRDLVGIHEVVVTVDGEDGPYYFHMIARERHLPVVRRIGEKLQQDYEK